MITGSRFEMASISPFFIAATALEEAPTPMIATSSGLSPSRASKALTKKLVLDPGAVTPIFSPFRSFGDLYAAARALGRPSAIAA